MIIKNHGDQWEELLLPHRWLAVDPKSEVCISGFVLSSLANPIPAVTEFYAQLQILELLENAIFTPGYRAVLHIHSVVEECEIVDLLEEIDMKTKKPKKKKPLFVKNGAVIKCRIQLSLDADCNKL
ncbi:hypothetical protein ABKV19_000477 [Rosa sericea]